MSQSPYSRPCVEHPRLPCPACRWAEEQPDVAVHNEGTLFLFGPLTDRAKTWIAANVQADVLWFGDALVIENRFAADIARGMRGDGLTLQ